MRECPVFYPTLADLKKPFEAYIEKHEKKIAEAGIAKIVAPEGWTPRRQGYPDDLDFTIERPIRQHATGSRGLYRGLYIEEKPMSLRDTFRPQATAPENLPPPTAEPADLERKFWRNLTLRPPLYGADVLGSLFDEDCPGWNLRRLDTVLSRVLHSAGHQLPGVSEPYLYFGSWRSMFAWHTEDLDLYSVNYVHYGASKQWYCIPPHSRKRFEGLIRGMLPEMFRSCPEFFRHKELIISPQLLDNFAIPYIKTVQQPREFVINYPGAYHAGYNLGYNCAESVNFGTRRWIPLGAAAGVCKCNPDSVTIDMRLFRHLVPARLLPPSIFEDTSSSESASSDEEAEDSEEPESGDSEQESEQEEGRGGVGGKNRSRGGEVSAGRGGASAKRRGGGSSGRGRGGGGGGGGAVSGAVRGGRGGRGPGSRGGAATRGRGQGTGRGRGRRRMAEAEAMNGTAAAAAAEVPTGATSGRSTKRRRGLEPACGSGGAANGAATCAAAAAAEARQLRRQRRHASLTDARPVSATEPAAAVAAAAADVVSALPKRRGRPPKNAAVVEVPRATTAAAAVEAPWGDGAPPPPAAKRPRGRPRKHLLPPPSVTSDAACTVSSGGADGTTTAVVLPYSSAVAAAAPSFTSPPVKRSRGRPRKVAL